MSLGDEPAFSEPQAMRALAAPVRLAILTYLRTTCPATATMLSPQVGATPSVTSWHLRHLATHGLVTDAEPDDVPGDRRHRWWRAMAVDVRVQAAPQSSPLGSVSFTQVRLTTAELEALTDQFDQLLAPYLRRSEIPAAARPVRIIRQYLPGLPDEA